MNESSRPQSLQELKKSRGSIRNANIEYQERLTKSDKLALWITTRIGTIGFFIIILSWTVLWLGWNILAPTELTFDPYPAFVLWLFISNMIQILLMPLIMIGQNLQGKHAEARAEADFDVNTKAEREIENILFHLEKQDELILEILNTLHR